MKTSELYKHFFVNEKVQFPLKKQSGTNLDWIIKNLSESKRDFHKSCRSIGHSEEVSLALIQLCATEMIAIAELNASIFNVFETCEEYELYEHKLKRLESFLFTEYSSQLKDTLHDILGDGYKSVTKEISELLEREKFNSCLEGGIKIFTKVMEKYPSTKEHFYNYF